MQLALPAATRRRPRNELWRDNGFVALFGATGISELGSYVSFLALPLAALYILDASALEVALIRTVEVVPVLLFALPVGVWVDRMRRRPLMIAADLGRAASLASIPVAYSLGSFTLAQLYVVVALNGLLSVWFDLSVLSFIPGLVRREQLGDANARLMGVQAGAGIAGPTVAGALVGLVGAAVAVIADAASFACSGALVATIRGREPPPRGASAEGWAELKEGIRFVFAEPTLRILAVWVSVWNFFSMGFFAVEIVYFVRELHLASTLIGVVFGVSSSGFVVASLLNDRAVRRFGLGRMIAYTGPLSDACWLAFPLAPQGHAVPFLIVFGFLGAFLGFFMNVNQLTLRQSITPPELLGRMNSVVRLLYWGTIPAGAAVAGALATPLGLRTTLLLMGGCSVLAALPITFSPIRRIATVDAYAGAAGDGGVAPPAE
jgi:MFS family permease